MSSAIVDIVTDMQSILDDAGATIPGHVHLRLCALTKQAYDAATAHEDGSDDEDPPHYDEDPPHHDEDDEDDARFGAPVPREGDRSQELHVQHLIELLRLPPCEVPLGTIAALTALVTVDNLNLADAIEPVMLIAGSMIASNNQKREALRFLHEIVERRNVAPVVARGGIYRTIAAAWPPTDRSLWCVAMELLQVLELKGHGPLTTNEPHVANNLVDVLLLPDTLNESVIPVCLLHWLATETEQRDDYARMIVERGGMRRVASMVDYVVGKRWSDEKDSAMLLLSHLALKFAATHCDEFIEPILVLLDLLSSPAASRFFARMAARTLARIAAGSNAAAKAVVEFGGVPKLIDLLNQDGPCSTPTGAHLAEALCAVCVGRQECEAVVRGNGIPALVRFFALGGTEHRLVIVAALGQLVGGMPEHQKALGDAGGVGLLLECLRGNEPRLKGAATATLANLLYRQTDLMRTLCAEGGVPLLVELARSGAASQQRVAARALANVSARCVECRKAIAEAGGVDALLDLVRQSHVAERASAAEAASSALISLTGHADDVKKSRKRQRQG
jgi:hypothetical protein